ncbi:hypothetical protein [Sediminitomix flava]|uniref:LPP20 lipoprotein n=1 Tax=Sediminitomix flava TaxID=379075 RepID=A0A315ZXD9_SEDFL|nr:hypothetical protein [Sediminitomix flava]PWJ42007.1 hypothetical protein BC781_103257 [Sediminitomix flava]
MRISKLLLFAVAFIMATLSAPSDSFAQSRKKARGGKKMDTPLSNNKHRTNKDFYRAVSSHKSKNQEFAKKNAIRKAKAEIAAIMGAEIKRVSEDYEKSVVTDAGESLNLISESFTREVVDQSISGAYVSDEEVRIDKERDPKTKKKVIMYTYYVCVELDRNQMFDKVSKEMEKNVEMDREKFRAIFDKEVSEQ